MPPVLANSLAPRARSSALRDLFRQMFLRAWRAWLSDAQPSPDEVEAEVEGTTSAMRQLAKLALGGGALR